MNGTAESGDTTEGTSQRRLAWVVLVMVACHVAAAYWLRTPGLGWGEDDSQYVLLSRALQSFSYRELWDVVTPIHARYPPGFPAILAMVGAVSGNSLAVMFGVVAICSGVSILLLYDALSRTVGYQVAFWAALLCAVNPSLLLYGGTLLSEAPFTLFVMLAVWGLARERDGGWFAFMAGAATVAAALVRTAGVVLLMALALHWFLAHRYRRVAWLAVGSLPVIGWLVLALNAPDATAQRLYVADIIRPGRSAGAMLTHRLTAVPRRVWQLASDVVPFTIGVPTLRRTAVDNALWLVAGAPLFLGGMLVLWRRWRGAFFYLITYLLLLTGWAFAFPRLLTPVAPLLLATLLLGAAAFAARIPAPWRNPALAGVALLLLLGALQQDSARVREVAACDRSSPATSAACWPEAERTYLQVARWMRDSLPADAAVFAPKEAAFYFHSGHRTVNQVVALRAAPDSLPEFLRANNIRFAVAVNVGPRGDNQVEVLQSTCAAFSLRKSFGNVAAVLVLREEGDAADSTAACAAVRSIPVATNHER